MSHPDGKGTLQDVLRGRPASEREQAHIHSMLDLLKLGDNDQWDYLLIGDGSGSVWDVGIGYSCLSVTKRGDTFFVQSWYGANNYGTNNTAEISAYVVPLVAICASKSNESGRLTTVHIATDSEYTAKTGQGEYQAKHVNGPLWALFSSTVRYGVICHWHWIPRASHPFNRFADAISRKARIVLTHTDIHEDIRPGSS